MHRFSRMHLSPAETVHSIDGIDLDEKSKIAEWIALIGVIDERKDYLAAGYSCTRNFCMGRLHMSDDEALRRIQVARTALRFPELFEYLADGRLGVTTASVLAPRLEADTADELLAAAAFQPKHEVIRLVAERARSFASAPTELASELLAEETSREHAPAHVVSHLTHCDCVSAHANAAAPVQAHVELRRRGRVSPSATGAYEVRLTITQDEHEDLRKAQASPEQQQARVAVVEQACFEQQARDAVATDEDIARASSAQRARDTVATGADMARANARAAVRQERYDVVYCALRGLRADPAGARRGAEAAAAMPDDATLEECMKVALTAQARPLLMRCKRTPARTP
jgi:hypothetical protein